MQKPCNDVWSDLKGTEFTMMNKDKQRLDLLQKSEYKNTGKISLFITVHPWLKRFCVSPEVNIWRSNPKW